jgi:hypothetical protein
MNNKTSRFFLKANCLILCISIVLTSNPAGANLVSLLLLQQSVVAYPVVTPIPVTTDFGYDGNSNLTSRVDGNGNTTAYE